MPYTISLYPSTRVTDTPTFTGYIRGSGAARTHRSHRGFSPQRARNFGLMQQCPARTTSTSTAAGCVTSSATAATSILSVGGHYDYREGVSVWYRSFLAFQPQPEFMADAPLGFQLHALVAFALFALWPFTRLVHVFSAPVGYLTRPYVVYRSRDDAQLGSHRPRRGWDRVG
jgi:nitrate reductase alpha subunit